MLGWLKQKTRLHFIGIGGIGMSGIAEILLDLGHTVSGSDVESSSVTEKLKSKGAIIYLGHDASHVDGASVVIYSSAIKDSNPEWTRALEIGLPLIKRAQMLAEIMHLKTGIAIAGSHGKTTTTSLVATIFEAAEMKATHVIGGIVENLGGNARFGEGEYFIAEADESDGSFLMLRPTLAVITNIDNDHLDHYRSKDKIVEAFVTFVNNLPINGCVSLNANDDTCLNLIQAIDRSVVSYGIDLDPQSINYVAKNIHYSAAGTMFELFHLNKSVGLFKTHLVGEHNVSNALAAVSISHEAKISFESIREGLLNFRGVGRRLEKIFYKDDFVVLDDYGHHPTEIMVTIKALKKVDPRPLCVVFEPHRYSRTQNFWEEFQMAFEGVDEVFITPIYPASEIPIPGINSEKLVSEMSERGGNVKYLNSLQDIQGLLEQRRDSPMVFLSLGAGAISKKMRELVKTL